jgi:hypothetical protein
MPPPLRSRSCVVVDISDIAIISGITNMVKAMMLVIIGGGAARRRPCGAARRSCGAGRLPRAGSQLAVDCVLLLGGVAGAGAGRLRMPRGRWRPAHAAWSVAMLNLKGRCVVRPCGQR